ncbi:hypothetical protein FDECE_18115 [Fusarium decemcellulare]|nr:hypothetical protein FDECE_18115 [Fusarium decemcellulare]
MLPHQGQGAAQGMEDVVALGIVLYGATSQQDMQERLQFYMDIRYKRASVIQILSNVGQDQSRLVRDELLHFIKEDEIPATPTDNYKYNFSHDVVAASIMEMKKYWTSFKIPDELF